MEIKIEPVKNNEVHILANISAKSFYDTFPLISQLTKEISLWPFKIKGLSLLAVSLK